jgi:hypothetical protein
MEGTTKKAQLPLEIRFLLAQNWATNYLEGTNEQITANIPPKKGQNRGISWPLENEGAMRKFIRLEKGQVYHKIGLSEQVR